MTNTLAAEPTDAAAAVGERIKLLAWRGKITHRALAKAVGVAPPTMSKKLRGDVPMTVAELYRVADALRVTPADLLPRLDSNQQPSG